MSLPHRNHRSTLALLILIAAGYAGNYFSFSVLYGLNFLFGSIAVLVVVHFFGSTWGTLAAIVASTYTVLAWNHPYAAIVFTCEAVFVGLLLRRQRQNIVLLDVLYWLLIGMPLLWLFNFMFLHVDGTQIWLVMLKHPVNGTFNALVANLIITHLPIHKWIGRPQVKKKLPLQQILLNQLMALVLIPLLLFTIVHGNLDTRHIQIKIQAELQTTLKDLIADMSDRHQQYLYALSKLGQVAAAPDMTSDILQGSTNLLQQVFPDFQKVYIVDTTSKIIASSPTTNASGATISNGEFNKFLLKETQRTLQPFMTDVHIDPVLHVPHIDLSVPVVAGDRFRGFAYASLNLSYISKLLQWHIPERGIRITLIDSKDRIIASTQSERVPMQPFDRTKGGEIRPLDGATYLWLPAKGLHIMVRWKKAVYVQETPIGGNISWTLVVEVPASPYVSYLQNLYIGNLAFIYLIAMLAILCAVALSRPLASTLSKLASVTTNLPNKLLEREAVNWPNSPVTEIDSLVGNCKFMAIALNEKFGELKSANETLEQRVAERTAAVLQSNQQLAIEISERQQAESALKASEERFRQIAENIHEVFWMTSVDKYQRLYISPAYEEIWGRTCASLYEQSYSFLDAIHPDDRERVLAALPKQIQGEYDEEYRIVRPDGSVRWIRDRAFPIRNEFGEVYRITGIAADISERKQGEQQIRYALEKERQLIDLKSRFISTASHEFRTPLTIIFMSAKLLEQYSHIATEEKKRQYVERIQVATKRMTQLLDDVLLIGKAEAGKLDFNPAPLDLEKFCCELVEEMQLSADSKHIITFVNQGEYTTACLDENLMRYILSNLLSNAIKYSPQGGNVNFNLTYEQGEVIFRIQDQGIGITVADQEQLFHPFHRGSNVSTIPGTGLGMSIVKQYVDLHGGKIAVNSEVGVGTTFIVTLPLKCANSHLSTPNQLP